METMKAIAIRKSTRGYASDKQVGKEQMDTILAAGYAAPIGRSDNASLHLTVVQSPEAMAKIDKTIQETLNTDRSLLYGAPTFVLVSASKEQAMANIQFSNAACVIENMLLAAADIGVDSIYLWGAPGVVANNAALRAELGIPEGFAPVSGALFGYALKPNPAEKDMGVTTIATNFV